MNRDDAKVFLRAILIAAALILCAAGAVGAAEPVACWKAKALLAYYGGDQKAAEATAKARGYTAGQIAEARKRCGL
jgi:hypothetical protein